VLDSKLLFSQYQNIAVYTAIYVTGSECYILI